MDMIRECPDCAREIDTDAIDCVCGWFDDKDEEDDSMDEDNGGGFFG